ncbi:MAG: malate dehydrogenase (quinone) [Aquiluna sp.]|nr:malate dehydrogenase (quinone) [Aquiluna sp.]
MTDIQHYDYALIGGGIMSATLGVLLKAINPAISLVMFERLDRVASESSNPWNNAGTGHAALCELNYMPDSKDGSLPDPSKAIAINEQFQVSRQFWSALVKQGILHEPASFIRTVPHMTFVRGEKDCDYLKRRHEVLSQQPLFAGMEYSTDLRKIAEWIPLVADGRQDTKIAVTRTEQGTDVDYGSMTEQMVGWLVSKGMTLETNVDVKNLYQFGDGKWQVWLGGSTPRFIHADKVFVGAGGYALKLLQKAAIPEIRGYGTFPVSGHFLRTDNPDLVSRHKAKVYSQADVGAPPMSVPHLDTRVVDGKESLLFGPYAGLNPKFLKHGSILDLPGSLKWHNLLPYLSVAIKNLGLVRYLIGEIMKSKKQKIESLRAFIPTADPADWTYYEAGQRAQVIKPVGQSGTLQFGTEVISSTDGSIAGLLGASPGASVSVSVMLDVLQKMEPSDFDSYSKQLRKLIPTYNLDLNADAALAKKTMAATAKTLKLKA